MRREWCREGNVYGEEIFGKESCYEKRMWGRGRRSSGIGGEKAKNKKGGKLTKRS